MDAQMKRGLLETCVLAVLRRGESYGYQIIKDLADYIQISESTLYPILKRLESVGCLYVKDIPHNGRLRRFYGLTVLGEQRLDELFEQWSEVIRVYELIKKEALQ